ncbi:MAG TPA: SLBB domain-containing protein [Pyrinomonadaceae bacterium]
MSPRSLILVPLHLLIATAAIFAGLGRSQSAPAMSSGRLDRIHRGDLIEIDEMGGFDFDWRGKLNPEGYLDNFTKVADPIFALCSTPDELAEKIREAYSKTLRDPRIRVRILDRSDRPFASLDGAVRQPARFSIRREVSLVELLTESGGLTDQAGGEVTIYRPPGQSCEPVGNESSRLVRLTIGEILSGDANANPKITSGDLVTVHAVLPVYVIGGVNRPGKVDWRDGLTVSRAVAMAGGVSDRGVAGDVSIYRRDNSSPKVIQIDLDKVTAGSAADVELKPYDILDVPLKGSGRRTQPPVVDDRRSEQSGRLLPLRIID